MITENKERELVCQADRKIDLRPHLIWLMPTEGIHIERMYICPCECGQMFLHYANNEPRSHASMDFSDCRDNE